MLTFDRGTCCAPFCSNFPRGRQPAQARFWLDRGCSALPNSVIPTGTDHRKAMSCGAESLPRAKSRGTLRLMCASDGGWPTIAGVGIKSERTTRKHERAAGELRPALKLPTQAKERLEWATGLAAGISDSRPSQKTRRNAAPTRVGNARKVKSPGHPAEHL